MPEHESGNKLDGENAEQYKKIAAEILSSAPVVEDQAMGADAWRQVYANPDRGHIAVVHGSRAKGSYGDYGNDLFAPPTEFGGGGFGGQAAYSPTDGFSHPARYGNSSAGGYHGREGWVYNKGANSAIDHMRIAQCVLLYKTEGIVQTIVHLLADFVVESVDLIHPDETVHNFYQAWKKKVKLKDRLHRMVVDLLTTGNVFMWTREAELKQDEKTAMKRGFGAQLVGNDLIVTVQDADGKCLRDKTINVEMLGDDFDKFKELKDACEVQANAGKVNEVMLEAGTRNNPTDPQAADKKDKTNTTIPWEYISLNPLQMQPRGSRFANEHYWVMMLSKRDLAPLSKFMSYRYYTDISTTQVNLPEIFKGKLKVADKGSPFAAELRLDEGRLSVIQDITKADYEEWATPQIYPAHKEVSFKRMLRQAEISAMESFKHAITLIKLGDVVNGFIPTPEQIERVAAALAGGSQVHHLIWDNLIEGQILQPDVGKILDPKKYQQVDKDIYSSLGISEAVMTGNGSFANSFMSIKLLLEKLETIRCKLQDWLQVEVKKIADAMKFRRLPIIEWGLMNLRDENAERKLWLELYDRGIVSDESMLQRFGTDFKIESSRQEFEAKFKEANNKDIKKDDEKFRAPVMVSRGPFNRDLVQKPKPAGPAGPKGGRPVKTGTPQTKKRNTKPKGMAAIQKFTSHLEFATNSLKLVADIATKQAVETQEVKDVRSLTKAQKVDLEQITLYVLAAINPDTEISETLVYDVLTGDDSVFSTEKCQKIVALYQEGASAASTKEERFNLMCNAYAAVNADLLEESDEGQTKEGTEVS